MIDKKNLDILKKIAESKDRILVSYTEDKHLPDGTICEYKPPELYWLKRAKYIRYSHKGIPYDPNTGKRPFGEVEATPEGRALVERSIKEKKNTLFFEWFPLIFSAAALIVSILVAIYK